VAVGPARIALALLVLGSPLAAGAEEPLCAALARARAAAPGGFEEVRGAAKGDHRWDGKVLLPGFEECLLQKLDDGSLVYSCSTLFEAEIAQSRQHLMDLAGKVEACLGPLDADHKSMDSFIGGGLMARFAATDGTSVFLANLPALQTTADSEFLIGWTVTLSLFPRPEDDTGQKPAAGD
jgi:hypothetical protein